ncbi:MAG: hypothetical protein ACOCP8_05670 [archaeon]
MIDQIQSDWKKLFIEKNLYLSEEEKKSFNENPDDFVHGNFCKDIFHDLYISFRNSNLEQYVEYDMSFPYIFDIFLYSFKNHKKLNSFIDLGCGVGFLVASSYKFGFNSIGVEKNLELLTLGKNVFKKHNINTERLIKGNFLDSSFWENSYHSIDPTAPNLFLLYQPKKFMEEALWTVSSYLHKDSRIITGGDYFSEYNFETINKELCKFNIEIENLTRSKYFVLKKSN